MARRSGKENPVLALIRTAGAEKDFSLLVQKGANPDVLVGLLANMHQYSLASDCFESLTASGLSRKNAVAYVKKIRSVQGVLGPLTELVPNLKVSPALEEEFLSLSEKLSHFCNRIEILLGHQDYRQAPAWNHLLTILMHYVNHTTSHFRDEQVARLITAVTEQHPYGPQDLKRWRSRNRSLLSRIARQGNHKI